MTEEDMRAFESQAPTTLHQQPATPPHSWERELFLAAAAADIPRMARAFDRGGVDPNTQYQDFGTAAYQYAMSMSGYGLADINTERLRLTSNEGENVWAWFKARGVPLTNVWDFLYSDIAPLADPIDANCAELNLWALWKNLSSQDRLSTVAHLDRLFSLERPSSSSEAATTLKGLPKLASPVMKEVLDLEGLNRSPCGALLSADRLQDRVLALSSLFRAKQGLSSELSMHHSEEFILLGLWAYAPATVLHDLEQIPAYHALLTECLTSLVATFHKETSALASFEGEVRDLVTRRLARGTRTLLQNKFEFSPEDIKALLTIDAVRPLLEQSLFKKTLDLSRRAPCSKGASRSRIRL